MSLLLQLLELVLCSNVSTPELSKPDKSFVNKPPHISQIPSDFIGDHGGYFPDLDSVETYRKNYVASASIQADRVRAINSLLHELQYPIKNTLYFGIGDGTRLSELNLDSEKIVGMDISPFMIEKASSLLTDRNFTGLVGDQHSLKQFNNNEFDLVLLIHVLGYIPLSDRETFFYEIHRILKLNGMLIISVGNKLFDLFALNSGTRDFFVKEFNVEDTEKLLIRGNEVGWIKAQGENPLSLKIELARHGLIESDQSFSQWHVTPPELRIVDGLSIEEARSESRIIIDYDKLKESEKWQCLFRCSTFASSYLNNY
jgi:SAM-dependent methyltransferase